MKISICAVMLMVCAIAHGRTLSPQITNPENGHTYILLDSATWKASEAEAVTLGGHLATIRSRTEEDWVVHTFGAYGGKQRLLWIGLSDTAKKFHFSWSSGESLSYTCWAQGEPNNAGRGEDFVSIYYPGHSQGGKWNDWGDRVKDPIGLPMNGVVEVIPAAPRAPAALATAAAQNQSLEPVPFITITPAQIVSNSNSVISLQWPATSSNYMLEATTNLAEPFTMFGYSETINAESGMASVVVTNPIPQMFFRLRKQ